MRTNKRTNKQTKKSSHKRYGKQNIYFVRFANNKSVCTSTRATSNDAGCLVADVGFLPAEFEGAPAYVRRTCVWLSLSLIESIRTHYISLYSCPSSGVLPSYVFDACVIHEFEESAPKVYYRGVEWVVGGGPA